MFFWVCQFLLVINCTLFHDNDLSYLSKFERINYLKASFIIALLLIHADLSKPFGLKTDAFDFALGVVLSQPKKYNLLHLVSFHFHKFSLAKINYEIHDKEPLAIVDAFEMWHRLLEGA
jgi:hypothetical protein